MLAAHLQRLARRAPVRYADHVVLPTHMPPDLTAAIRNYLLLSLRGADVPHLHHQAQETFQPFYQEHPQAQQAFGALTGEQPHPADLIAYLDMLDEHGGEIGQHMAALNEVLTPVGGAGTLQRLGTQVHPVAALGWHLHNLARPLRGNLLSPNSPVRAFSDAALARHPDLVYRHYLNIPGHYDSGTSPVNRLVDLMNSLRTSGRRGVSDALFAIHRQLATPGRLASRPTSTMLGAAQAYDIANQTDLPSESHAAAARARSALTSMIERHLIPHLYENQPE